MEQYIDKSAVVAEIEKCYNECLKRAKITDSDYWNAKADAYRNVLAILDDTLEVKEVDTDKMLCFRRNTGFAYPEGASEYQRHLACYRQGIEDVLKAQKGE